MRICYVCGGTKTTKRNNGDETWILNHDDENNVICYKCYKRMFNKPRDRIIYSLGGKCVGCGFTDIRALQLDHINGGGSKERREMGQNINVYNYYLRNLELAKQNLQVLCANCNSIKRFI